MVIFNLKNHQSFDMPHIKSIIFEKKVSNSILKLATQKSDWTLWTETRARISIKMCKNHWDDPPWWIKKWIVSFFHLAWRYQVARSRSGTRIPISLPLPPFHTRFKKRMLSFSKPPQLTWSHTIMNWGIRGKKEQIMSYIGLQLFEQLEFFLFLKLKVKKKHQAHFTIQNSGWRDPNLFIITRSKKNPNNSCLIVLSYQLSDILVLDLDSVTSFETSCSHYFYCLQTYSKHDKHSRPQN